MLADAEGNSLQLTPHFRWVIICAALTLALIGLWVGYGERERNLSSLALIGWGGFGFLCLLSTLNYALRYLRWNYLLKRFGHSAPTPDKLLCYLSGFALTTTPAKSGEVVRSYYFKLRHGIPYSHSLPSLFTERLMDALACLLLGTLALYTFENVRWIGALFSAAVAVVVLLVTHRKLLLFLANSLRIVRLKLLHALLDQLPILLQRTGTLLSPRSFTLGFLVGILAWSTEGFAFAWLARELGGEGSIVLYMSIFCIAVIAGAMTFVPGGLGGTEVVMYLLCVATGMGEFEAITATIVIRLATLWYAVACGLLALLCLESRKLAPSGDARGDELRRAD